MKTRKLLALLLAMVMLIGMMPLTVSAYDSHFDIDWSKVTSKVPGERIAQIAQTQLGYFENDAPDGVSGKVKFQTGSSPTHYYNKYYPNHKGSKWCVRFIVWCARQAGVGAEVLPDTGAVADLMKKTDGYTYHKSGSGYVPKIGDIAVYGWEGANFSHAEIIISVNTNTKKVTTIGGNTTANYEGKSGKWGVGTHTFSYTNTKSTGNRIVGVAEVHYPTVDINYDSHYDIDWSKITATAPAERLAQIAESQVGYFENTAPDGVSGTVMFQTGSNPEHHYNKYYPDSLGYKWCARFITWCARQAGIDKSLIPTTGKVATYMENGEGYTYHKTGSGYTPKMGDIAVYGWGGAEFSHAEIVVSVDTESKKLTSIGGNTTATYNGVEGKWGVGKHTFRYDNTSSTGDRIVGVMEVHYPAVDDSQYDSHYDIDWSKVTANVAGERVAQIAETQIGYFENDAPDGVSGKVMFQTGSNPVHYYNKYYPDHKGNLWCVRFIVWCARQAGVSADILPNTGAVADLMKDSDGYTYHKSGSGYVPKLGDIAVYGWSGADYSHAEIIVSVNTETEKVTTVGGSTTGSYNGESGKFGVGTHSFSYTSTASTGNRIVGIVEMHYDNVQTHEHTEKILSAVAPTCTENGLSEGIVCVECGEILETQAIVLATGHSIVIDEFVSATCTEDGLAAGQHCENCGEILVAQEVIPATGHDFAAGKCTICGVSDPNYVAPTPTVTPEPTVEPTPVVTPEPTVDPTPVLTATPAPTVKPTPEVTATPAPTVKPTPVVTATPAPTVKPTPVVTATPAPTVKPTPVVTATPAPTAKPTPVVTATPAPTVKPTPVVTATPAPTAEPTPVVTATPVPTAAPTPTPEPVVNPFIDVAESDYYFAPVMWAVEHTITGGTGPNTFSPDNPCTRSQIVTFLWAANGRPEPKTTHNPFEDVSGNDYYYKAVLWAVENGITGGTSSTTFSPNAPCTRAQVATFLYAAKDRPAVSSKVVTFGDVASDAWYLQPVLWAAEQGITGGIGNGMFGPDQTCTRGQIVTFLYKAYETR